MEFVSASALWAMHPSALDDLLKRGTIEAMLPDALKALSALGGHQARAPADPIRDGGTMIIPLNGVLTPRGSYGGTSTERFSEQLRTAGADDKVGAIIVPVSSPGGLVYGTQEAADAVYEVRAAKPIIAVASPYCFSAAHWIATSATAFYASPSAEVGNVGVRGGHVDKSGFEDKIGMKTTLVGSDPEKIARSPYAPLTDEDRASIEAEILEVNDMFVASIARGRGIAVGAVRDIHGAGRTFSAAKAAAAGVTDGVMTVREAVAKFGSSRARLALMRRRAEALAALHSI